MIFCRCGCVVHEHRNSYLSFVCWKSGIIRGHESSLWFATLYYSLCLSEDQSCIGLSVTTRQAPKLLSWTNSAGTPIPALLATSSISALCFASSFIGSGELWGWLQNIVGVCSQVLYSKPFLIEKLTSFARLRGSRLDFQVGVFARPG